MKNEATIKNSQISMAVIGICMMLLDACFIWGAVRFAIRTHWPAVPLLSYFDVLWIIAAIRSVRATFRQPL